MGCGSRTRASAGACSRPLSLPRLFVVASAFLRPCPLPWLLVIRKGLDTRQELLAFHKKHYHAQNMALVVLGKEDLDELEGLVRDSFREVRVAL